MCVCVCVRVCVSVLLHLRLVSYFPSYIHACVFLCLLSHFVGWFYTSYISIYIYTRQQNPLFDCPPTSSNRPAHGAAAAPRLAALHDLVHLPGEHGHAVGEEAERGRPELVGGHVVEEARLVVLGLVWIGGGLGEMMR